MGHTQPSIPLTGLVLLFWNWNTPTRLVASTDYIENFDIFGFQWSSNVIYSIKGSSIVETFSEGVVISTLKVIISSCVKLSRDVWNKLQRKDPALIRSLDTWVLIKKLTLPEPQNVNIRVIRLGYVWWCLSMIRWSLRRIKLKNGVVMIVDGVGRYLAQTSFSRGLPCVMWHWTERSRDFVFGRLQSFQLKRWWPLMRWFYLSNQRVHIRIITR